MGGDLGPIAVVPAVLRFLNDYQNVAVSLFGQRDTLLRHFPAVETSVANNRCRIVHCEQTVADDEQPALALRHKQQSSMSLAMQAVADGQARACISGGNTGALMAMGLKNLGIVAGVDRPAICTRLPAANDRCYLLDLGANVDCSARHLHQFARMAAAMHCGVTRIRSPRIALLNIGRESTKGNKVVKEAAALLTADSSLNYVGFVEADQLLAGWADAVVCDGFAGNIALKAMEGTAKSLLARLAKLATEEVLCSPHNASLLGAGDLNVLLGGLSREFNPATYNGAILLGLQGVAIKSHGNADADGFYCALEQALMAVQSDVPALVAANF